MATWLVGHAPWLLPVRARLRLEAHPSRSWIGHARSHLSASLQTPSPVSLEIETMPYPTEHLDASIFEPISEEYASVSTPGPQRIAPLSSAETLASLVLEKKFLAAESLRKELVSHHVHIPPKAIYIHAALRVITHRRLKMSAKHRLEVFEAWLSLAPDRDKNLLTFHQIRQRLFLSMDHLSLKFVHRFGVVLASKGYYGGKAAMQVVSTLARYAQVSVVADYLRKVEDLSRDYHSKKGAALPSNFLAHAYGRAIRTVAIRDKGEAALDLISMAQSRGFHVSDITLNIVSKHALDKQVVVDRVQDLYPSWIPHDTTTRPITAECEKISSRQSADIVMLAARLRSLRIVLRSHLQPSPHVLRSFIESCLALGRTRAIILLRSLAYRHSPRSASTWAFAEMHHHYSRREFIHALFVFSRHFHLVGVPQKSLLSITKGKRGQKARKLRIERWVQSTCPMNEKLWPTPYHTALVWETIVSLSKRRESARLYTLLVSQIRQSRQLESGGHKHDPDQAKLHISPTTYVAAHFSPFLSLWARKEPTKAAGILRDMVELGIEPTAIQWSMVARGYAQHDDPAIAMRILDRLVDVERRRKDGVTLDNDEGGGNAAVATAGSNRPSDVLLGAHTNVLRGLVIRGDMERAREMERRLVQLGYETGDREATDRGIALLRMHESEYERLLP